MNVTNIFTCYTFFVETLFSYGTLTDPEIQKRIVGRELSGQKDFLSGYDLSSVIIEGVVFPCAIPSRNGKVSGMVYQITIDELVKVDDYEGKEYRRKKVSLSSGHDAWVYVRA